jgi:hypothetical protein
MPPPFKKYKTGRVSHGPAFLFCFKIQIAAILPELALIMGAGKIADMEWIWKVFGLVITVGS